ncbi:MAG TPA: type III polyketide synthase, partial [Phycisphaerales bacterium]|nr:type III polyketide synthase [Phycisphaerales bacterium]
MTHLVTVSCTGARSPGIDHGLIERLGLSPDVSRTHVGFMGCHAGLNGLAVASAFVRADPDAVVMLVCVELCSLHYQVDDPRWDQQVANAIFADGAACALIGSSADAPRVTGALSRVFPDTASRMGWEIGQHGFRMTLSPRVPGLIRRHLGSWLEQWLAPRGLTPVDIDRWVVHPGGRDILEGVRRGLELDPACLSESERVLERHGNMSSATIL